jgi:putative intracellular protease/amidase
MANALRVIIPLPSQGFDPTEVAVIWRVLHTAGHTIEFATPDGLRGEVDPLMLSGEGLDVWGWLPGLKKLRLFGLLLRANRDGRQAFEALARDPLFLHPRRYADVSAANFDALVLPGGHAKGVRVFLESDILQRVVAEFFDTTDANGRHKPVAAVCHGVVLAARSVSGKTGRSVLYGRKTTALPWAMERQAWHLCKYLIRFWDADYYRTYLEAPGEAPGYRSVQQEVTRALASPSDFLDVPASAPRRFLKTCGLVRDRLGQAQAAWVVRDGNYVSARWPGDMHTFSTQFLGVLANRQSS